MDAELLGEMVGAALTTAVVAFFFTRKQTGGVVPYLAALGAAIAGIGGVFLFNAATHRFSSSEVNIAAFEANFSTGCLRSCTGTGAAETQCRTLCACVLTRLHARYPSNERFASWFRSSDTNAESVKKEVVELSQSCVQATR